MKSLLKRYIEISDRLLFMAPENKSKLNKPIYIDSRSFRCRESYAGGSTKTIMHTTEPCLTYKTLILTNTRRNENENPMEL